MLSDFRIREQAKLMIDENAAQTTRLNNNAGTCGMYIKR